jgi:DegV family protein with EDD domain
MSKIAIVTDSTVTMPDDILRQYPIFVAPCILIWGEETYRDGIDIKPAEFYTRLKTARIMPTTSQVPPNLLQELYSHLAAEGYEILSIFISDQLSGTMQSGVQAKAMVPNVRIELFDSKATSMAMGFQVLAAARAAAQGASLEECIAAAEKARELSGVLFVVDTLEFLHRMGRIGGGARFLGTALDFKPILELKEGRVEAVERVRSKRKAYSRLLDLVERRIAGRTPVRVAVLHANAEEDGRALLDEAARRFQAVESILTELSPVIGANAGPGTIGLAYLAGM